MSKVYQLCQSLIVSVLFIIFLLVPVYPMFGVHIKFMLPVLADNVRTVMGITHMGANVSASSLHNTDANEATWS